MTTSNIGIWLVGARGGVATTAITGLCALKDGLAPDAGLVSQLPAFQHVGLPDWGRFVVGGHEIRDVSLVDEAMRLAGESRAIDPQLIERVKDQFHSIDDRIRPGTIYKSGPAISDLASEAIVRDESPRDAVGRLKEDMTQFAESGGLEHVIVVNLASTEPPVDPSLAPASWAELEPLLDRPQECPLPASSLYAIAALELGYSYLNFAPSLGSAPRAIDELARLRNTRHMGSDGKTGETLMKSVLAPMFHDRNLKVMSWVGHNIFGNLDGRILDDPVNKATKVTSKDRLLAQILEYRPQTLVSIEYIESLGDWKTAWDHIHFTGFLGTPMTLQFTWQGCDSLLAAPLVLDMIRFTDLARRRGHVGLMPFLACFFKSPQGVEEQGFIRQFQTLEAWANEAP
ncbi:inositol-3-phosphate synthase [Planctomycetota bacterium]